MNCACDAEYFLAGAPFYCTLFYIVEGAPLKSEMKTGQRLSAGTAPSFLTAGT